MLIESERKRVRVCARRGAVWSFARKQVVCALSVMRIFHVTAIKHQSSERRGAGGRKKREGDVRRRGGEEGGERRGEREEEGENSSPRCMVFCRSTSVYAVCRWGNQCGPSLARG